MWARPQPHQAIQPVSLIQPKSITAGALPMVAMSPEVAIANGPGGRARPAAAP